jgi:hypothetical protein
MSNERFVDFLFSGAAVVPAALTFAGDLGMATMLLCPLLIGACLAAAYLEGPPADGKQRVR